MSARSGILRRGRKLNSLLDDRDANKSRQRRSKAAFSVLLAVRAAQRPTRASYGGELALEHCSCCQLERIDRLGDTPGVRNTLARNFETHVTLFDTTIGRGVLRIDACNNDAGFVGPTVVGGDFNFVRRGCWS